MTRIIAGRARGHRLLAPKGDATRPTTDRTREALFSTLVSWFGSLDDVATLDLYAGSGAIALEAASRGAAPVVAVEANRQTATLIGRNAAATGLAVQVVPAKVGTWLAGTPSAFDLVFADPPYDVPNEHVEAHLAALLGGWLAPDALVVVERSRRDDPFSWPPEFVDTWHRDYGETTLYYGTTQPTEDE